MGMKNEQLTILQLTEKMLNEEFLTSDQIEELYDSYMIEEELVDVGSFNESYFRGIMAVKVNEEVGTRYFACYFSYHDMYGRQFDKKVDEVFERDVVKTVFLTRDEVNDWELKVPAQMCIVYGVKKGEDGTAARTLEFVASSKQIAEHIARRKHSLEQYDEIIYELIDCLG